MNSSHLQHHNGIQQQGNRPTSVVQPPYLPPVSQHPLPSAQAVGGVVRLHHNLFDSQWKSPNAKQQPLLIDFAKNDQSLFENYGPVAALDDSFLLQHAKGLLDATNKVLATELTNIRNEIIFSNFLKHAPAFGALDIDVSYRSGLASDELVKTWFSDRKELIKWARSFYQTLTPYEFLINKWLPLILSVYYSAEKGFPLHRIDDLVNKCCLHLSGEMGANVLLAEPPSRRQKHSLPKHIKKVINSFKRTDGLDMYTLLSHIVGTVQLQELGHAIHIRYSRPKKTASVLLPPIQFKDRHELLRECSPVYLNLPMLPAGTTSGDVKRVMNEWTWSPEVLLDEVVWLLGPSARPDPPVPVAPQDVFQHQLPPAPAQVVGCQSTLEPSARPEDHPVTVAPQDVFQQQDWEKYLDNPVPINVTEANEEEAKERRQKRDELQRRKDAEAEKKKKSNSDNAKQQSNNTSTEKSKEQEQEQEKENNGKKGVEEEQKGAKQQQLVSKTCNKYLLVVRYQTDPLFTNS